MSYLPLKPRHSTVALLVVAAALLLLGCPIPGSVPEAPSGLDGIAVSSTSISLTWNDASDDERGFRLERKTGGGSFHEVVTLDAGTTSWTDAGLVASTAYTYQVYAFNRKGDSPASNTVTVTTLAAPPAAPAGLTATAVSTSQIDLSWTDNSSNETGFDVDRSVDGTGGWSLLTTTSANVVNCSNTDLPAGARFYYRVRAKNAIGNSANSNTADGATLAPAQAFKVANSWGKGFTGEKYPDGFYYITYNAFKAAKIYCLFMDDKPAAYNPTILATFQITHPRRGDCNVQVGVGTHISPLMIKTFNYAAWTRGDANPFPSNVMAIDVTEFAPYLNTNNLFLKVEDASEADGGTIDTGTIQNFTVEKYSSAFGGAHTTLTATGTPRATVNGDYVYVDLTTVGFFGSGAPTASAAPSRISSLVSSHAITGAELADLKQRVGVAVKGRNYNVIFGGYGTGLRPPTEEEWNEIQRSARIVDSIGSDYARLPPSVDLSALNAFPPIGNQASQGSCVAWSIGYYLKTFQEALERGWNLSTVKMIGSWPSYYPDSQQNHILSPTWTYNQINGGGDNGSSYTQAARLIFDLGTVTWQTTPYTVIDPLTWPSEAAYREAPWYRGVQPQSTEYDTYYSFVVDTDTEIGILKALLANNVPVSISIDAGKYPALSADDLWDEASYPLPASTNHANTLVGYRD
jgi:hypothetical protein